MKSEHGIFNERTHKKVVRVYLIISFVLIMLVCGNCLMGGKLFSFGKDRYGVVFEGEMPEEVWLDSQPQQVSKYGSLIFWSYPGKRVLVYEYKDGAAYRVVIFCRADSKYDSDEHPERSLIITNRNVEGLGDFTVETIKYGGKH